jgi:hypothetical protein
MIALDWLHGLLAVVAVAAPLVYIRLTGASAQEALAKVPILSFLVKTLAARANLAPEEHSAVSQALGETHPGIPASLLALQVPVTDQAKK